MVGIRISTGVAVVLVFLTASVATAQIPGDYNRNGVLDAADLDQHRQCENEPECDLNGDTLVDYDDRLTWIHELKHTWQGDANLDLEFNSGDLVQVFVQGKYEADEIAGWEQGDWNGDMSFSASDLVAALVDEGYEKGLRLLGDYNRNGLLDAGDLDLQAIEMVKNDPDLSFDPNEDGLVDFADRQIWVNDLKNTWVGDANLDGEFNSGDLVQVFTAGKYNTGEYAKWEEGDFNGDMLCGSGDFVWPGLDGLAYEKKSRTDAVAMPEPGAWVLLVFGVLTLAPVFRQR